ncbi:MAG TPA: hypothetical protein VNT75_24970 [Symbiobacteriaceae bacterium]|nr:hypothetical protein [Symbiobacteriaceae bacterium]
MKLLAVLFVIHGLISFGQSFGGFKPSTGTPNPAWMSWWPTNLGQSWLFEQLGVTSRGAYALTGVLWLLIAVGFVAAGAMLFASPAKAAWAPIAAISAILSLVALGVYLHPWYTGAVLLNLGILAAAMTLSQPR